MNASLKRKLIAGFILAFLAGGAAGAFLTLHQSQRWRHHPHSLSERMRDRIKSELDLTPEQFAKVRPILDRAANQLEKIRIESGRNVRQVLAETNRALEPDPARRYRSAGAMQADLVSALGFHTAPDSKTCKRCNTASAA